MKKLTLVLMVTVGLTACGKKETVSVDTNEYRAIKTLNPGFSECMDTLMSMEDAGYKLYGMRDISTIKAARRLAAEYWSYQNGSKVAVFYCDAITPTKNLIEVWDKGDYDKRVAQFRARYEAEQKAKRLEEVEANKKIAASKGL